MDAEEAKTMSDDEFLRQSEALATKPMLSKPTKTVPVVDASIFKNLFIVGYKYNILFQQFF
jgi:hypothetical protein